MQVRQPNLDFSQTPPRWTRNGEFAQSANASSTTFPYLEPFLNRVMSRAKAAIDGDNPADAALRASISTFIKQESCHYKTHADFNQILIRAGYDRIPEFNAQIKAHYDELLKTRSLAFLCAYCEGFETLGPPSAIQWLDEMDDVLEGADPNAVALWKWHLMEEYEHRNVCHEVFNRIHGGYFLRVYCLFYQAFCLFGHVGKVRSYILEEDRKHMSPEEREQSVERAKVASRRVLKRVAKQLLKAMSPFYNPRNSPEPKNYRKFMAYVEESLVAGKASVPDGT